MSSEWQAQPTAPGWYWTTRRCKNGRWSVPMPRLIQLRRRHRYRYAGPIAPPPKEPTP
jgi:hypothetical protein